MPAYTVAPRTLRTTTLSQPTCGSVTSRPCNASVSNRTGAYRTPNTSSSAKVSPVGGYQSETPSRASKISAIASSVNHNPR